MSCVCLFVCILRVLAAVKDFWHWAHVCKTLVEWICWCLFRPWVFVNILLHWSHFCHWTSATWRALMCNFRAGVSEKHFWHCGQECGFSPVWVIICDSMWIFWEKYLPHSEHLNGFIPPCTIFVCFCNVWIRLNDFSHCRHEKGFSLVWIILCDLRWTACVKDFSHFVHLKFLIPSCLFSCLCRHTFVLNDFSHLEQWYGLIGVCVWRCSLKPAL